MVLACFSPLAKHWLFGSALEGSEYLTISSCLIFSRAPCIIYRKTEGAAVWQGKYQAAACWLLADGEGSCREDGTPGTRQGNTAQQPLATCLETKYFNHVI